MAARWLRLHLWAVFALALPGFALALAGAGGAVRAAPDDDAFTVRGIVIDASAESASAARNIALASGQRRAIDLLLRRMTLKGDHERLPRIDEAELGNLVLGLEIADERTSARRYVASLTVAFKSDLIRTRLREAGISYSETVSKPVLVLALLETDGRRVLWEEDNPWRAAWVTRDEQGGLLRFMLPLGDLADVAAIDPAKAAATDEKALGHLLQRYNLAEILVAESALRRAGAGPSRLEISLFRHGPVGGRTSVESYQAQEGETEPAFLQRVVNHIVAGLQESWKRETSLRLDRDATLSMAVGFDGLREWSQIRDRLVAVSLVREVRVAAVSRRDAQVILRYFGDPSQLVVALAQRDLDLAEKAGYWHLRMKSGGPPNAAPAAPPAPAGGSSQ